MTAYISESEHATLVVLLDERRRVTKQRKQARLANRHQPLTLAQKLENDRPFVERLEELNDKINNLMKREGESE